MTNPFDFLFQKNGPVDTRPEMADAGPWGRSLSGASIMAPAPSSVAPAPAPARGYNALMDPSQSQGILGIIGGAMGFPTQQEHLLDIKNQNDQQGGMATHAALALIQKNIDAGMNPQKAVVAVMNTPEGQDWFMRSKDPVGDLKGFMGVTNPDPVILGAGASMRDNQGTLLAQQPTTKTQEFLESAKLQDLDKKGIKDLAQAQAQAAMGDAGAFQKLIQSGMDPVIVAKLQSGVIKIQPGGRDPITGNELPAGSIDNSDPNNPVFHPASGYGPSGDPLGATKTNADADAMPGRNTELPGQEVHKQLAPGGRGGIVRGAGIASRMADAVGTVAGTILPGKYADKKENQANRAALEAIRADARNLRQSMHVNAGDNAVLDNVADMTFNMTNPMQALDNLVSYNKYLDNLEKVNQKLAINPKTHEERVNAYEALAAIARARANLPTIDELEAERPAVEQEIPALEQLKSTFGGGRLKEMENEAAKTLKGGEDAVGGGKSKVKIEFNSIEEAESAEKAGLLKGVSRIRVKDAKGNVQWYDREDEGK